MPSSTPVVVWFRNDLRISDNPALYHACMLNQPVVCVYIYSRNIGAPWENGEAKRFWLYHSLKSLHAELKKKGNKLIIREGDTSTELELILRQTGANAVFFNELYDPLSYKRDKKLKSALTNHSIQCFSFHGNLAFDPTEIYATKGSPYKTFAFFWKSICKKIKPENPLPEPLLIPAYKGRIYGVDFVSTSILPKNDWMKKLVKIWKPGTREALLKWKSFLVNGMADYEKNCEILIKDKTSLLSSSLHFGEISPKEIWHHYVDHKNGETFLKQIALREFTYNLLYFFPCSHHHPVKKEFSHFSWNKNEKNLKAWQEGITGYPIIDAAMRQLKKTGWMHNRLRKITASFLVKDLLISWLDGAKWFWQFLVDADMSNNTFGWQWCLGSGFDAPHYSKILDPVEESKKLDPKGVFIREFVPEISRINEKYIHAPWEAPKHLLEKARVCLGDDYPMPICNHKEAKKEALRAYSLIKKQ